jgi:hypothetical protein
LEELRPIPRIDWTEYERQEAERDEPADRARAYATITREAQLIGTGDWKRLKSFLDVLARMERYSVGNTLLISAQMPGATDLRRYTHWRQDGVDVFRRGRPVLMLEASHDVGEDGKPKITYTATRFYDVSQTSFIMPAGKRKPPVPEYMLKTMLEDAPCGLQTDGEWKYPENESAYYDPEDGILHARKDRDADVLIPQIAEELVRARGHAELGENYSREATELTAKCAAYVFCKRYGALMGFTDFTALAERLKGRDARTVREELEKIREQSRLLGRTVRTRPLRRDGDPPERDGGEKEER